MWIFALCCSFEEQALLLCTGERCDFLLSVAVVRSRRCCCALVSGASRCCVRLYAFGASLVFRASEGSLCAPVCNWCKPVCILVFVLKFCMQHIPALHNSSEKEFGQPAKKENITCQGNPVNCCIQHRGLGITRAQDCTRSIACVTCAQM